MEPKTGWEGWQIKEILRLARVKPAAFFASGFLSLTASVCEALSVGLLVPFLRSVAQKDFSFAGTILVLIFTFSLLKSALIYFEQITILFQIRKFSHHLRDILFRRYLGFGKLYFDQTNLGHISQVLMTHTHRVAGLLGSASHLLNLIFMLGVYAALLFMISWKLSLVVLSAFPLYFFSAAWLTKRIARTSLEWAEAISELGEKMFNILSSIPLVKSYCREDNEEEIYGSLSKQLSRVEFSLDRKVHLVPFSQEILTLCLCLILASSALVLLRQSGSAMLAGFLVYFFIIRRALNTIGQIDTIRGTAFSQVTGSIGNILEVLSDDKKYRVPEGARIFEGLRRKIDLRCLNYSYVSGVSVLKNLSFSIEKGKTTALVGPSGAGKSTIVSLIMRFYDCPPGSIFLDGVDIRDFTFKSLRERIAFVAQETLLFNDTLRNNLAFGLNGTLREEDLIQAVKKARLYDFVTHLPGGLETLIGDRGVRLSGGEKQRVSIARAILKKAEILILDEATSSLDSSTEKLIQEAIDEIVRGRTSIVIAHRLSTVRNADKVVLIDKGELVEEGTPDELLARKGKFYEHWEAQGFHTPVDLPR